MSHFYTPLKTSENQRCSDVFRGIEMWHWTIKWVNVNDHMVDVYLVRYHPSNIYLHEVNNRNSKDRCQICLKLVSAIFNKFLFSTNWQPFKNYERCFLFHLKSSFRSRDIPIFLFPSVPLFLPVSHCFRAWSKINLKVSDVLNCLNKNSFCLISSEGKKVWHWNYIHW